MRSWPSPTSNNDHTNDQDRLHSVERLALPAFVTFVSNCEVQFACMIVSDDHRAESDSIQLRLLQALPFLLSLMSTLCRNTVATAHPFIQEIKA